MPQRDDAVVEAAGGVLWRPDGAGVQVALVHRPKYDDWSLPKGKLNRYEAPVVAAVREVREETGFHAAPGRPLGELRYLKDGAPKRVRYWSMPARGGEFVPGEEVDELAWLAPAEARPRLVPGHDSVILDAFLADPRPTWPLLLVRHASAGDRDSWAGPDEDRPLDQLGERQAVALAEVLAAYRPAELFSADRLRCLETFGPYAARAKLVIESEPLLSDSGYASRPQRALHRLVELASRGHGVAVCSQGGPVPELVPRLAGALGAPSEPVRASTPKGGYWAVHLARGDAGASVVAVEEFPPPTLAASP